MASSAEGVAPHPSLAYRSPSPRPLASQGSPAIRRSSRPTLIPHSAVSNAAGYPAPVQSTQGGPPTATQSFAPASSPQDRSSHEARHKFIAVTHLSLSPSPPPARQKRPRPPAFARGRAGNGVPISRVLYRPVVSLPILIDGGLGKDLPAAATISLAAQSPVRSAAVYPPSAARTERSGPPLRTAQRRAA